MAGYGYVAIRLVALCLGRNGEKKDSRDKRNLLHFKRLMDDAVGSISQNLGLCFDLGRVGNDVPAKQDPVVREKREFVCLRED